MIKKRSVSYDYLEDTVEIINKPLFYTGLGMQIGPLIILGVLAIIYGLSKIDFTWIVKVIDVIFEPAKLYGYAIISGVLLYYITSLWMIKEGTKKWMKK